jgi:hypothetical protein
MTRVDRRPGAKRGSLEHRARISHGLRRYHELRREAAKLRPRDLDRLRSSGTVIPALRPLLDLADLDAQEIMTALGGLDDVSPMRRQLVEDVIALGIAMRATTAAYLQTGDGELASRLATLANARRQNLVTLGLEHTEREITLRDYLVSKGETPHNGASAASATNGADPEIEPAHGEIAAQEAHE